MYCLVVLPVLVPTELSLVVVLVLTDGRVAERVVRLEFILVPGVEILRFVLLLGATVVPRVVVREVLSAEDLIVLFRDVEVLAVLVLPALVLAVDVLSLE